MNFGFTEEQELLRDQVRRFLEQHATSETVREIAGSDRGFRDEHWKQMADLGWLGLIIAPEHDGVGLGWVDLIVILEEMGRALFPSPFISNTLASSVIAELGSAEQKKAWLPKLAGGQAIATLALLDQPGEPIADNITLTAKDGLTLSGTKSFIADAGAADLFLVAFRVDDTVKLGLVPRDTEGVSITSSATMDLTKRTGSLTLDSVALGADSVIDLSDKALERIFDQAAVAVTAEMVGAAEAMLTMTTDYARERIQFDHPIGKYQGVKHRLAEMYVDIESFKSLLYYAAWAVNESPDELPRSASLAKAYASDAFASIGIDGIQLHGAIGFTAEYDAQLYLKRSKWARPAFGDADFHYERVARLGQL